MGETERCRGVQLGLICACDEISDCAFDSDDIPRLSLDRADHRGERRRLAAERWAGDEDHAVGVTQEIAHDFHRPRRQAELLEWQWGLSEPEETKNDLVAEQGPKRERPKLDIGAARVHTSAPLLQQRGLPEIQTRELLDMRDKDFVSPLRQVERLGKYSVEAVADDNA